MSEQNPMNEPDLATARKQMLLKALSLRHAWLKAMLRPMFLLHAMQDAWASWFWTRNWFRVVLVGGPCLALLGLLVGGIGYGQAMDRSALLKRYAELAETERLKAAPSSAVAAGEEAGSAQVSPGDAPAADPLDEDRTSPFGQMLYRRMLQLQDQSPGTQYMVALQLARDGKEAQAQRLMRKIAPPTANGFPPAHTWLALQFLGRGATRSPEARPELMHHLREAMKWGRVPPRLQAVYADLLEQDGQVVAAVRTLSKAADEDPSLQVPLTAMALRHGIKKTVDEASETAERALLEKLEGPNPKLEDQLSLASLWLIKGDPDKALEMLKEPGAAHPDDPRLKRLVSESLRVKFRKGIRQDGDRISLSFDLLDAALRADPSNPAVEADLALVLDMGQKLPDELNEVLKQYVAEGRASALTHLVFANQLISSGKIAEAVPHLEVAARQAPAAPIILNNLSLALAMTQPDQRLRAQTLIAEAIKVTPSNPVLLDTQGHIYLLSGQPLDAIAALEKVIRISPDRQDSRQLLAQAYRAAGLEELAQQQEEIVARPPHDISNAPPGSP
jgi:tetratricopeptide (TPR) repeat protein